MHDFKKILFPLDLSESSAKIVPFVKSLASRYDARVHLLFVARVFDYFTSMYVPHPSVSQFEKEVIEGAEKRLYEFADENFAAVAGTKTQVVAGDPSEEILGYIAAHGIDLVVMGTHGRKGLDKVIFGSVAERVVKSSPVPVMVVNPFKVAD
ncbi:MAG TPA: universal stress protein [Desulfobacterales bacterium]|jgi:nucleotide-binding universal stress UspA family protein|nr:universal stress protein [Desulfobacterales bacterium]